MQSRRIQLFLVIPLIALITALMAYNLPPLLTRLFRPFSYSTRLSIAPDSSSGMAIPESAQKCTVAAGCFWGTDHLYRKHFGNKGLLDAKVGYIGGDLDNPTYRAICGGKTGREYHPALRPLTKLILTSMMQTQKPYRSFSSPHKSPTANSSNSSTAPTTPPPSTVKAPTPVPSTAPPSITTMRSRRRSQRR